MAQIQAQEWHYSGSSCCSPFSTCLLSWCCPCITYGRAHHRVKNNGNMQGYSSCNMSCLAFCGLSCLGISFILPMISRGDMRAKYHLKGNGCTDCLCACCCAPCDLTQQDKEAEYRETQSPINQQPQKTAQMLYGQQPQQPQQAYQQPQQAYQQPQQAYQQPQQAYHQPGYPQN